MRITRIDGDKELSEAAELIDVKIGSTIYRMTEYFGELMINADASCMNIHPRSGNEVTITSSKD